MGTCGILQAGLDYCEEGVAEGNRMIKDKWILSPPGGPAGPFWGVVTQTGKVIASQIIEREHAEILRIIGNVLEGDDFTIRQIGNYTDEIAIRNVIMAIWTLARNEQD
jgi:hypothetical protein